MEKIKEIVAITIMALAILLITGVVKAETDMAKTPGKVETFIQNEIEKTKAYQAKSWADAKAQWQKLLSKFQAN
tara:strand:+ start:609 stop:830 length:222 start_codon:yes stop_codon:yes gene_type:complete